MDHADDGSSVLDESQGDAEEGDRVGVVDGAVERIAHPGPARGVRPLGLLAEEGVPGKARGELGPDEMLRRLVDLGDDVAHPLEGNHACIVDPLGEEPAGPSGDLDGGRQLGGTGAVGPSRHREQATANGRSAVPSPVTRCSNTKAAPGATSGVRMYVSSGGFPM